MEHAIEHDVEDERFTLDGAGGLSYLLYRMRDATTMDTTTTFTPRGARGQGIAGKLTRAALDYARDQSWKVAPSCSYVDGWMRRHAEYEDLRA